MKIVANLIRYQRNMFNPVKIFSHYLNTRKLHAVAMESSDREQVLLCSDAVIIDITNCHSLISLKPFAIAVNAVSLQVNTEQKVILRIVNGSILLGELPLLFNGQEQCNDLTLFIYQAGHPHYPLTPFFRLWNSFLLSVKNRTNTKSKNFVVPPAELLKLFVFSLKPRPVYLFSLLHREGLDAFPVDITGNISEQQCLFSIRSSSAAIPLIKETGKACASLMPYDRREEVYQLGSHHAGAIVPVDLLPAGFIESSKWKIPVPSFSITVQELLLEHTFTKGVHTQLVFNVVNRYPLLPAEILAHTPWFNRSYF